MVLFTIIIQATFIKGCLETPPPAPSQPLLTSVVAARSAEKETWVVDVETDDFYQTPTNASSYLPGNLIKFDRPSNELLQKYTIPAGLSLYCLMYQSTDINNRRIAATAFILLPYTHPRPSHGKPLEVIAWAHGTSGIDRLCAPSNLNNLYYDFEAPFAMALQGFAMIAPDYAGLGTNTTFNYEAGPSHAADVVYAVSATRQVLSGKLSEKWVVVGHSEGGLTAWATNEREARQPTQDFLGAVAIAPALAALRILQTSIENTGGHLGDELGETSYIFNAIARLDKSVNVTKYYSQVGFERATLASTGCFQTAIAAFENLTFSDVFQNPSWPDTPFSETWENRTGVHGKKQKAKSEADAIHRRAQRHCGPVYCYRRGVQDSMQDASRRKGASQQDPVLFVSQLEYFDWIREIFKGVGPKSCKTEIIDLVTP